MAQSDSEWSGPMQWEAVEFGRELSELEQWEKGAMGTGAVGKWGNGKKRLWEPDHSHSPHRN